MNYIRIIICLVLSSKLIAQTVDLSVLDTSVTDFPSGVSISWHTATPPDSANLVPDITSVQVGDIYYMSYYDTLSGAFEPSALAVPTLTNSCPADSADLLSLNALLTNTPVDSGIVITWHTDYLADSSNLLTNTIIDSSESGTYYIAYWDTIGGCVISTPVLVEIEPCKYPTATISGDTTLCEMSMSPSIIFRGEGAIPPYTFDYSVNGGPSQNISTLANQDTVSIAIPTNSDTTYTYILTSVTEGSTRGLSQAQPDTVTITVNPLPTGIVSGNVAVCASPTTTNITFTGNEGTPPYTFEYSINGVGNNTITSFGTDTIISVSVATAGIYSYELISVTNASCSGLYEDTALVTVNALPTASILTNDTVVCLGVTDPVNVLFEGASGATPYTFSYEIDGTVQTDLVSSSATSTVTTTVSTASVQTYTYTLLSVTDSNSCSQNQFDQVLVEVRTPASASIAEGATTRVCQDDPVSPILNFSGSNGNPDYSFIYTTNVLSNGTVVNNATDTILTTGSSSTTSLNVPTKNGDTLLYILTGVADNSGLVCPLPTDTAQFIIDPLPKSVITSPAGRNQCINQPEGVQLDFSALNVNGQITFSYTEQFGTDSINAASATVITPANSPLGPITTGTNSPTDTTIYRPISGLGTTIYNNGISSSNVCDGSGAGTIIVTVNPVPTATVTLSSVADTICETNTATVTFQGNTGTPPYTFTYDINGGGTKSISTSSGQNTIDVTLDTIPGSYTFNLLTVRDSFNCNQPQPASVTIKVDSLPLATAGGTTSFCLNGTSTVSGATSSNGTVNWTENGGGTLSDQTTLSPTYTPVASDAGNAVILTMTVSSDNACIGETAIAYDTVNVDSLPLAIAGGTTTICENSSATVSGAMANYGTILWTHDGSGSLTNETTLTPTYTAIAGDTGSTVTLVMTVTSTNSCGPEIATASYDILVESLPQAVVSGSTTICENGSATVLGAANYGTILWTENGLGSLTGGTTETPTYTATAGDTGNTVTLVMTVTSTNTCGNIATASYDILVESLPQGVVSGSTTICENSSATVLGAIANYGTINWTHSGLGELSDETTLTPTYAATAGDTGNTVTLLMTVTSTNSCGNIATASYDILVDNLPQALANGSTSICEDASYTLANSETFANYGTILWTENGSGSLTGATTETPTYAATALDTGDTVTLLMTVTSTNTCGNIATASYDILVENLPQALASGSTTICEDGFYTLANSETFANYGTILWTENGSGSLTGATTETPTYAATAGDTGSTVTLVMTVTSTNSCAVATATASYAIAVENLPQAVASGLTPICENSSYTLDNSETFSNYGTINWSHDGLGAITNGTTETPTYIAAVGDTGMTVTLVMTVTSTNSCTNSPIANRATASYGIAVENLPQADVIGSTIICSSEGYELIPEEVYTNYGTIEWTHDGAGVLTNETTENPIYTADIADAGNTVKLSLVVTSDNTCGTNATADYAIQVRELMTVFPNITAKDNEICQELPANILFTIGQGSGGPYTVYFETNINGAITENVVTNSGSTVVDNLNTDNSGKQYYKITKIADANCEQEITDLIVDSLDVLPLPELEFQAEEEVCEKDPPKEIFVKASNGVGNVVESPYKFSYNINDGINQSLTAVGVDPVALPPLATKEGVYVYNFTRVTDNKGCQSKEGSTGTITVNPLPDADFNITPTRISILDPEVTVTDQSLKGEVWIWKFGEDLSLDPQLQPEKVQHTFSEIETPIIRLIVLNGACADTITQTVEVYQPPLIFIPNTFTPNGNGLNEVFKPIGSGLGSFTLEIYDRWGELVFTSSDINEGWDGRIKGEREIGHNAAYVYVVNVKGKYDGKERTYRGIVNMLK